jgi:chromosome segregation ATPase
MLLEEKENHISFLQGELEVSVGKVSGLEVGLGEMTDFLGKEKIHNEEKTKSIMRLTKGNKNLDELYSSA